MKIVQINSLFAPRRHGGTEVFLEQFSAELVARGHQVVVACLSPTPTRRGDGRLHVHEFPLRNVYWPFDGTRQARWRKAVWHLRNAFGHGGAADIDALLERERPDLVHTHNLAGFTCAVWQTIRARGIPLVHTIHDYALLCPATTMFRRNANCGGQCLGCRLLSWPKREHSRAVNAVVGVSGFALDRHLRGGYFTRAAQYVIQNGDPRGQNHNAASREPSPVMRVGYLGRLAVVKGVELMLDSLLPLVPHQCELIVGGSGDAEYESRLKSRYEPRGVRFTGRVDAAEFLAGIDVLVVPSLWHEPFGLVLCEAMSAGVPIVASAVGGIPEVVEHGQSGFLFEPADGRALREHVGHLARDRNLHRQMSRRSSAQAESYRFDRTVDRYLRVYEQTLN
ncbi:MAG: glycosyltransferase family 4 protein [Pirellulales bacterium]